MSLNLQRPDLFRQACLLATGWHAPEGTDTLPVHNPATGELIGHIPKLGYDATVAAIAAAEKAQPAWAALPAAERARILRRWHGLMLEHADDLARLMTIEQGKPLAEARGEISYAASFIEWFAEEGKRIDGEILQAPKAGQQLLVTRQPIGVCAAITPWNFPAAMITRKAGPALAAGCTMVLKPAENTPYSAMALGVLALEAGIPAGVLQIITGDAPAIGKALTESPTVRKLSFTGSTQTGRLLMRQSSDTVKKLSLELGGNAPLIVFEDADIDRAVAGILASKFRNVGQTCVCANRIYIHDSIYDEVARRVADAVSQFKVGNGLDAGVTHGPMINAAAVEKVQRHIADALARGATLLTGGKPHALGGNFFEPTVLANVTDNMLVCSEETFGPIAPLFRFTDETEVVQRANATIYGLAAYIFTEDQRRTWRVSQALEYGMVGVNTGLISNEASPFGGVKQSGLGREGSRHGMDDYLEMKYVCLQLD
ncbi:NAD-dependent succinate-semialdehyde dehydrogenase [Comamonas kerstersii]|uniref:NAD-dependent succinate-semialdehyde dehydrogenase n=1 Tax=Comamonas kerstersii TaxID=225992 RepID=A0A6A1R017_9BURK|nr:NAD-dependent succinate-semialdehyde dehydrogenase [Comamonas kerstersii]KAB0585505.1 NAD-dependent succinate-semialdehyde dehydrogenase [Comamonas kerstersii]